MIKTENGQKCNVYYMRLQRIKKIQYLYVRVYMHTIENYKTNFF